MPNFLCPDHGIVSMIGQCCKNGTYCGIPINWYECSNPDCPNYHVSLRKKEVKDNLCPHCGNTTAKVGVASCCQPVTPINP